MIVIIKDNNHEQWEDYHTWIVKVLDVKTDDETLTADILRHKYLYDVVDIMKKSGISVNPAYLNIMEHSTVKNKKLHKKILKDNDFLTWLEKNYKITELKFGEIMLP